MSTLDIPALRARIAQANTSQSLAGLEANYEHILAALPGALDEIERWRNCFICIECGRCVIDEDGCCETCGRDALHFDDGKLVNTGVSDHFDAIERKLLEREAQLDVLSAPIAAACIEHVELNGHLDIARQAVDWIDHEANTEGDPSGRLREFVVSLITVIDQLDRQRRRANWYEAAHTAGKQKLIESAVAKALDKARAAAIAYAGAVSAFALAVPDCPEGMEPAGKIGEAQADLWIALGIEIPTKETP